MHFTMIDWVIVGVYITICFIAGLSMRRYTKKIDQYLVAGREVNVYLGVASLAATEMGLVTIMYTAESGYRNGFAGALPGILMFLAALFVGISGFVISPLRKANVMTIPELFETRYSKGVRWLAGLFIALGGILNMGIFLRLGGQFIVYCTGIPAGYLEITMTALILITLVYTMAGGMLSVLITDYIQFILLGLGIVAVSCAVIFREGLGNLVQTVLHYHGAGGINPFLNPNQGPVWVFWQVLMAIAVMTTWQTVISRILAAKDEGAARRIYTRVSFYYVGRFLLPALWAIGALSVFGTRFLEPGMDPLNAMPAYLGSMLVPGFMGLLIASMLAAEMSTDSSYLLAWASVIYNDLLSPLMRKGLSDKNAILATRLLLVLIAVFLLFFGLWYQIPGAAWDYLAITGSIYLSSVFALMVGALYWKRSNTWGAYAALVLGAAGPLSFLVLNMVAKDHAPSVAIAGICSYLFAAAGMIGGSLVRDSVKGRQV